MAQLEYFSSIKAGVLANKKITQNETITCGVWVRRTVDRPLPLSTGGFASNSSFRHQKLDPSRREIRLLTLLPGALHDPLRASLRAVSLNGTEARPGYEALSYTWGSHTSTALIEIDGFSYTVTSNLGAALPRLRRSTESRVLWIDAICIDQNNTEERSTQVQLMAEIYRLATRVVVWLGASTEHSILGMDVLREFAKNSPFNGRNVWRSLPPQMVRSGLTDIMQRSWFQRYWVVQEAALARNVIMLCGPHAISWPNTCTAVSSFLRAIKSAAISPQWQEAGLNTVDLDILISVLQMQLDAGPDARIWYRRRRKPDLLQYAYDMRHRQAGDIRDRIYSLIGLAGDDSGEWLRPNYSKPAEDVFDEFAAIVRGQTQELSEELDALKRTTGEEPVTSNGQTLSEPSCSGAVTDGTIENFIKSACSRAMQEVHNNEAWNAAQLLQEAATFLRSVSYNDGRQLNRR